jgi:folylpolyglutamate synthase
MNTNATDVETLSVQHALADTWKGVDGDCSVSVFRTVEETVKAAREVAAETREEVMVLATGSLHLVGGVVEVLEGGD